MAMLKKAMDGFFNRLLYRELQENHTMRKLVISITILAAAAVAVSAHHETAVPAKIGIAIQLKGILDSSTIVASVVGNDVQLSFVGVATDELVGVTAADTTPGFLNHKIVPGLGLTRSILNSGGDEDYQLDVVGFTETGGPTALTYAALPDGFVLSRSGTTLIGLDPSTFGTGDVVGPGSSIACPNTPP